MPAQRSFYGGGINYKFIDIRKGEFIYWARLFLVFIWVIKK